MYLGDDFQHCEEMETSTLMRTASSTFDRMQNSSTALMMRSSDFRLESFRIT